MHLRVVSYERVHMFVSFLKNAVKLVMGWFVPEPFTREECAHLITTLERLSAEYLAVSEGRMDIAEQSAKMNEIMLESVRIDVRLSQRGGIRLRTMSMRTTEDIRRYIDYLSQVKAAL
jgi:hypothetical protein